MTYLTEKADEIERISRAAGWYDTPRTLGEGIALIHSEVSEAFEAYRDHGFEDMTPLYDEARRAVGLPPRPKPEGVGSEFADIVIRVLDEARRAGIDLDFEIDRKIAYNATRSHRHGGKRV